MAKRNSMKSKSNAKPLVLFTLVVIVLITALFVITKLQEEKTKQPIRHDIQISLENQPVLGNENAPVTIVEFGDYKCPSCKLWGEIFFPQLKKDYIDTDKVKFAFINVLFHGEESKLASLAAESVYAQDPEAFWIYHEAIFDAQPENDHHTLWVTTDKLLELANTHVPHIDLSKFEADLMNETAMSEVQVDVELVEQFNVQLTPTIMINGIVLDDPFDYDKITEVIDNELSMSKQ